MKQFLIILFLLPSLALVPARHYFAGNKYYVSTSGTGSGNGLSSATPWTAAQFNASSAWGAGDSVLFKAGDTFRTRINFTRSGSSGNTVGVGVYGIGADPVISGYTQVTTWTSYGGNIWATPVSNVKAYLHNVLINGVIYHQARYPNTGYITFTPGSTTSITTSESSPSNHIGDSIAAKTARYCIDKAKITGQTGSIYTVTSLSYSINEAKGLFYFGDRKFLDTAMEYTVNSTTDSVLIYSTINPNTLASYVSTVDSLVYVTGSYIHFNHLTIQGGNIANVLNPFGSGNLSFNNCSNINGWFGYDLRAQRDSINGGKIRDMLSVGIWGPTNNVTKYSGFTGITMRAIGLIPGMGSSGTGMYEGINLPADGFYAFNNDIDSVGYHGIYSTFDSIWISYNKVNHFCMTLADGGGIYTHKPDTVTHPHQRYIIGNLVMNGIGNTEGIVVDPGAMADGIYLDAKTKQVTVSDNTVFGCSGMGIYIHGPTNTVLRNKCYDNGTAQFMIAEYTGGPTINNIVMKYNYAACPDTSKALVFLYSPSNLVSSFLSGADSNYYATKNAVTPFKTQQSGGGIVTRTLSSFQSFTGQENHSTHTTGVWGIVYSSSMTNSNYYMVGKYATPDNRIFTYLFPLGPLGSEIVQTLDVGKITIPAGARLKPH